MAEINNNDGKTKVIAFYLPQFHAILENDKAWGKGFTEWVNVKKAEPLFEGHNQPRIPLDNNYYNLLDTKTQRWQSELAQKYGVFGFCYYHYWFKNGKKLLEKPAENMLADKSIREPFCFCWANENWTKNWDGGNKEVIVDQDYGNEKEWEQHFLYLLDFFKDDRYITIDGKPVFVIYKPELIPNLKAMLDWFRKRSAECGFPGLDIMFQFPAYAFGSRHDEDMYDHYIDFEPAYYSAEKAHVNRTVSAKGILKNKIKCILGPSISHKIARGIGMLSSVKKDSGKLSVIIYDDVWENILGRIYPNDKFIRGAFNDWDNTARKRTGSVYCGASPEKFGAYFGRLTDKVKKERRLDLIFFNAWNEWGEGAYLEPDTKNGYAYLEQIRAAINNR